jgi:hypothetical protein
VADTTKKGLTPFGWLLVAGAGAYFLSSKDRRQKAVDTVRGWIGKPAGTAPAPAG